MTMSAPESLPDQARQQMRGVLRWLAAACLLGVLAWAVAQSQASSVIGSYLELQGQVVGPATSPTLNSTLDVSGGDTVRWTHFMNSRLESPFEAEGVHTLPDSNTWVRGSLKKPSTVKAQWQVNGQWTETEPADGTAVTAVKWNQRPMYEATFSTTTSAVDFQGTGDGYRVIPYKDKLFVVNHLGGGNYFNCRLATTGLECPGFEVGGKSFVSTVGQALTVGANGLWYPAAMNVEAVNYKTGELFMYMNNQRIGGSHLLCVQLDSLTSCGEWRMSSQSLLGSFEAVKNLYYMRDSGGDLHCFDIESKSKCGVTTYPGSGGFQPSASLGGKLYFSNHATMFCHDPQLGGPCSGWTHNGVGLGGTNIFGILNTDGSIKGVCTQSMACVKTDGTPLTASAAFSSHISTYSPKTYPSWATGQAYLGSKIYTVNESTIGCFDFATDSFCGSFRGSAYMAVYNVRNDPTRPGCVMALGDLSIAMIVDVTTGKACGSGMTGTLPDMTVNPQDYFQCDSARSRVDGWRDVRISRSIAWGGSNGLSAVIVTLKDEGGQVLPAALNPVRKMATGSYSLSIADIPYASYPKLTIGLKLESSGTLPSKVEFGADVTWDGDPQQVCVSTKQPAQPNCQLNSSLVVKTRVIGEAVGTPAETLSVATVLSPGGLSSGYSAVATPTSPRAVLSDLGARDPKTYVVQGRWALQQFSGDLWAFGLGANGQIDSSTHLSAQDATAAASARPMFTAVAGSSAQPVKTLEWASLSAGQQGALNLDLSGVTDTKGSARVDYLRGADGNFRARGGKSLGPVLSSSPAMLLPAATLSLNERHYPGYTAYRAAVTRPHPIALFGGNDGALHAYEVRPGSLKEAWSFVPDAMLRRAANYADPSLAGIRANPYFVDNIPMVGHANTTGENSKDGWRAVAVVTYGRGARAITALDVTQQDLSKGDGVLFEYSNTSDPELKDLGYIISQPVSNNAMVSQHIVQLGKDTERRAAVLVGNGIHSNDGQGGAAASGTGKAVLYAFYLDKGERRWRRWAVDELWAGADSEPALKTNNGLSMPTPVDVDDDGRVDLVYAGDLQGNLWRFDIRDPAAARVTRLFKTEQQQPITQAPFVVANTQATGCGSEEANASASAKRCWQVVFSTGAAIAPLIGTPNISTQSIYGVLDKGKGSSVARASLTAIAYETNQILNGVEYRALKPTAVNYKGSALGWVVDLQAYEHGVGAPRQQPTGLVMFSSIRPTTPDKAINVCIGPRSWLNEVDPLNGYSALVPFDTNGDGNIDGQDRINPDSSTPLSPAGMAVSGAQFGPPALLLAASTQAQQMSLLLPSLGQDTGQVNSWSGGTPAGGSSTPGGNSTALTHANRAKLGRMSWREVY